MSVNSVAFMSAAKDFVLGLFSRDASRSILPFVPRPLRFLFVLLLVLNSRSLPFTWHFRIFRPVLYLRLKWLSRAFSSRKTKEAWLDSLSPTGRSPFALRSVYETWASPDESDYNMHLSNSSYSKVLDMLRLKFALAHMSTVFRDGCWIALGATHLKFIREIPLGAKYEIRMFVGSWDNKWMYIVSRYVSKHKAPSGDAKIRERLQGAKEVLQASSSSGESSSSVPIPHLHTPAAGDLSGTVTPNPALLASSVELESLWSEAPGETLHCVAMNEVCFKRGRVTVPPALALAAAGCGMSVESWTEAKRLRAGKGMRDLLVGGWRDVPEGERWWDDALRDFESERVLRLSVLKGLREGLEITKLL